MATGKSEKVVVVQAGSGYAVKLILHWRIHSSYKFFQLKSDHHEMYIYFCSWNSDLTYRGNVKGPRDNHVEGTKEMNC